jgi:hypothetical protein
MFCAKPFTGLIGAKVDPIAIKTPLAAPTVMLEWFRRWAILATLEGKQVVLCRPFHCVCHGSPQSPLTPCGVTHPVSPHRGYKGGATQDFDRTSTGLRQGVRQVGKMQKVFDTHQLPAKWKVVTAKS